jgi:hypothetical protein
LNYQWRFNGAAIGGATGTSYTRTNAQSANAGNYTVLVTNSFGSVTSAVATLTVTASNTPPSITIQPQPQTVTAGQNATFSVTANGTAPLRYAWRLNNASLGATNSSYTVTNAQSINAGNYSVVVLNDVGFVVSTNAALTVNVPAVPPSIVTQPLPQNVTAGQNATFSVVAAGTAPLSYQWRFNGSAIGGATDTSYTRTNAQPANAGNYTVLVSNSAGSVTSVVATLTVGTPPSITSQPQLQSVTAGQDATFSVTASGTAPMNYQWRLNGSAIAGAIGTSYTRTNAQSIDAGTYSVLVTNAYGTAVSLGATLTVLIPPSIVTQPVPQTVTAGQSATFSVVATGTAPMRYVWRFNGASIFGATNSSYTVNNAQLTDAGNYSVVVLNEVGLTVSTSAALTVNPAVPPSIVTQPLSQTVIAGQSATFSVVATGTAPLRYQWRLNNSDIPGATNSTYSISNAQVGNAGTYSVLVSNGGGELLSSNATLNVNYTLTLSVTANGGTINTSPDLASYPPGTQVTLTAVPRSGYRFVNWQSGLSGSANPVTVTMNANLSVQAKFQKN